jgi:23S rRNA (cytidine1920-2'-O)/16S rRNA (cytidine1409-2'-O)-methyltransferase
MVSVLAEPMAKIRLDQLLVERGMVPTRTKAQALIMAGKVMLCTQRLTKPGHMLPEDAEIVLEGEEHPWVSRGGMKLAHALAHFGLSPAGKICLDVGSSTGGFTDVLLHHGAAKVYAVDVGHGQLDWKLRNDPRVVSLEKTNARYLTHTHVPEPVDWLVCDASFISLKTVLPAPMTLCAPGAVMVTLIKPQFEAGKAEVDKGEGVIRAPALHQAICDDIRQWLPSQGWAVDGIAESPITGPKGNKEFLLAARRS